MDRDQWQARYVEPGRVWSGEPSPWLVEAVRELRPGTALDIACGEGADAVWLARHDWDVTAVDFAPAALARTLAVAEAAGVADRVTCVDADVARWRPEATFDLVTVAFFHALVPLRESVHRMAWDATRGTLLVVGHDPRNFGEGHGGPPDPSKLYAPGAVLASLGIEPDAPAVVAATTRARHADDPKRIAFDSVVVLRRTTDEV